MPFLHPLSRRQAYDRHFRQAAGPPQGGSPVSAWQRLVEIYEPLARSWLRRQSLIESDSDDLVQEVMTVVVRRLPDFVHNGRVGAFRTWLRTITTNCLRDHWRSGRRRPTATGRGVNRRREA